MNKFLPTLFMAAGIMAAVQTSALAQDFSANVSVTNNYVWRGFSQSNDDFALQGGADIGFDNGISLGLWASNVKWGAGSSGDVELDIYGSYSFPITEMLSGNIGAIGYFYPDQPSGANNNFMEFNGGLDYDLGPAVLSGSVAFSPDVAGETTWYFNGGLAVPLGEYFELFANAGYYSWEVSTGWMDYAIGASASWHNLSTSVYYAGNDTGVDDGNFVILFTVTVP
jgi:uncharacterized protein (TIGR02001 family)